MPKQPFRFSPAQRDQVERQMGHYARSGAQNAGIGFRVVDDPEKVESLAHAVTRAAWQALIDWGEEGKRTASMQEMVLVSTNLAVSFMGMFVDWTMQTQPEQSGDPKDVWELFILNVTAAASFASGMKMEIERIEPEGGHA